ncbi:FTR1 family iron permease [Leptothermofonsia sp. ETS-13]|uniref:FTR1 family iron permease n=1 Tax=Leptothermofonsia sp. ETS-13 TaxID=3035696 RepID=UPI003BA157C9
MPIDLSPALPTFVITLREGVEAALVVGIVLAYLKKAEQTQLNFWVYGGIGVGLLASVLVGVLFGLIITVLGAANETYEPVVKPLLNGLFSVAAIAMLSWMLIWMTRQSRLLKAEVEGAVGSTLKAEAGAGWGAGWGIFGLIFFAVLREGFETVLFISARFQQGWVPILGAISGLLVAIGIGVLLFKFGIKINLRLFFQVMGLFLLLIVAGLVVSALAHVDVAFYRLTQINPQFSNLCFFQGSVGETCFLGPLLWDTHRLLPERQFPGIILHTLFGYEDTFYLVEAIGYLGFLAIVGGIYLQSLTGWGTAPVKVDR